jgi:excisionase family DNA binding protein
MQAYSRAALAPSTAAPSVSSVSSRAKAANSPVARESGGWPAEVVTAAQAFASLLLEGLSDQDLAVFARRLLPHLDEGQLAHAEAHSVYTVASLAAELGVSAKAIRCAIARRELQAVKRGARWIISADAVGEWATAPEAHHATGRRRSAPLPPAPNAVGPSLRSVLCGERNVARRGARGGSR